MLYTDETYDVVGKMAEFELGLLPKAEVINLFQHLINSGAVWRLQGPYRLVASRLLFDGVCRASASA